MSIAIRRNEQQETNPASSQVFVREADPSDAGANADMQRSALEKCLYWVLYPYAGVIFALSFLYDMKNI